MESLTTDNVLPEPGVGPLVKAELRRLKSVPPPKKNFKEIVPHLSIMSVERQ